MGRLDAEDDVIMGWARENEAVVLTRDLDFATALITQRHGLPSVIQLRIDRVQLERHLPLVRSALSLHAQQLAQGPTLTIEEDRVRIRVLDSDEEF